jgi:hypothetical protein
VSGLFIHDFLVIISLLYNADFLALRLGCWACHRCLAFCGGSAADLPADSPFIENVMLPELPPYPDTDDEIVEMVITRSNAWESAVITSGRTRIQTCDMRNGMQLTDVTGFTDTGLFEVLVE